MFALGETSPAPRVVIDVRQPSRRRALELREYNAMVAQPMIRARMIVRAHVRPARPSKVMRDGGPGVGVPLF